MSIGQSGALWARKRVLSWMGSTIVITRLEGEEVYNGICNFKSAEANQGQLSEPDPVEADTGSYQSYDIWIPYGAATILEGDFATITDGATLINVVVTSVESTATHKVAIQLRAVRQRTSSELMQMKFYRYNFEEDGDGEPEEVGEYEVQVVLAGAKAVNAGTQVQGGSQAYLQGTLIFSDKAALVAGGDTFQYLGRWGEITGIAARAADRLEVQMRIPGGGFD